MLLFVFSAVLLLAGGAAWLLAAGTPARVLWIAGTVLGLVFSVSWTVGAIRRHQPSVDVIAVLALAGALAVGEPFAGAVITVMLASGRLLEARASARARRELSLLVERAPRTARRRVEGGVVEVPVDDVVPGDRLLVGAGGVVPVDGRLLGPAVLDESALTGSRGRRSGSPARTFAAAWSTRGSRSTLSRRRRPRIPRTPGWCASSSRPRPPRRRSSAPPTGSPFSSSRSRSSWRRRPGRSARTPSAPSPCSSSRRRARCCSRPRSRSCPACPAPRISASSSRAAAPSNAWPLGR